MTADGFFDAPKSTHLLDHHLANVLFDDTVAAGLGTFAAVAAIGGGVPAAAEAAVGGAALGLSFGVAKNLVFAPFFDSKNSGSFASAVGEDAFIGCLTAGFLRTTAGVPGGFAIGALTALGAGTLEELSIRKFLPKLQAWRTDA